MKNNLPSLKPAFTAADRRLFALDDFCLKVLSFLEVLGVFFLFFLSRRFRIPIEMKPKHPQSAKL